MLRNASTVLGAFWGISSAMKVFSPIWISIFSVVKMFHINTQFYGHKKCETMGRKISLLYPCIMLWGWLFAH